MANLLLSIAARGAGLGASAFTGAFSSFFSNISGSCFGSLKDCCVCPHPTECGCIGAVSYFLGCQDHRKFNLIVEVHELDRLQKGAPVFLQINVGRQQVLTKDIAVSGSSALVEERLFVKVRQVDKEVKMQLMKKGVLKTELIASFKVRVKQDLFDKHFPKRQWLTMTAVRGVSNVKALVSFHYMDPSLPAAQSPLLQQAILLAQQEAEAKKEPFNLVRQQKQQQQQQQQQ
ncbi:hypothetical protein, conserved [Eimeria tenella]|uniref:Uncharacterized protein n=1 Tax=Eimeria tenella TaxID=5802 RepID=U6L203_EIMTE|nr:hypothetical protein, conserved [Eimeria tenella]CDJ43228.1 hypothetical protein, conserved [Eimeria tenella]|eukprot:XP_013233978.1 hypothetical protein, conserved [Eimeria tenella]